MNHTDSIFSDEILTLIKKAKEAGIYLFLDEDTVKFRLKKRDRITDELIYVIRLRKGELLTFLQNNKKLKELGRSSLEPIEKRQLNSYPLSYSQERLWFIDRLEGSVHYHVPVVYGIRGGLVDVDLL
ncbi:hypothetical protein RYH73_26480, partial [Olivibacter sp. CPCC 100613]|uniref:TubC N-terminal docking domain-related protein n=1 Tax=Olivibacter sp. CPCC 100613 TaxID=3079931 RepID=UPI002FF8FFE3